MADYISALGFLGNPVYWAILAAAVLVAGAVGLVPGVGGLTVQAIALGIIVFTVKDPVIGLTFLAAIGSLTNTLDSVPAVLLGYPGAGNQVTFLEGHQLAMRGQGAHTLGALYAVSAVGGLVGAIAILLTLPFIRPVLVRFSFPEIAAMALFGVLMVAALSRGAVLRGLIAGLLGILLGAIGTSKIAGDVRFSLGTTYLYDGLPIIPALLGFFALPELIDLTMRGTPVAPPGSVSYREMLAGYWYGLKRWRMTVRQSLFGVFLGAIPGVGTAVIDWLAYTFGIACTKDKSQFGKGNLDGVLFAESAQNSKEGGQFIPTLAFGVPGGLTEALVLVAMLSYGVVPGTGMLDINRHLNITMAIVATLGLGNLLMTFLSLGATGQLAKLTLVPYPLLAAALLPLTFLAAYSQSTEWGDILALCAMGVLGLAMKWLGWPRPPLLLGFILGPVIEENLWPAIQIWGAGFLTRPITIVLTLLGVGVVAYISLALGRRGPAPVPAGASDGEEAGLATTPQEVKATRLPGVLPRLRSLGFTWHWDSLFTLVLLATVGWAFWTSRSFAQASSQFLPEVMGIAILALLSLELLRRSLSVRHTGQIMDIGMRTGTGLAAARRLGVVLAWIAGYIIAAGFIGLPIASLLFAFLLAWFETPWQGRKRLWALMPPAVIAVLVYGLFDNVMHIVWPSPIFRDWLLG